MLSYVYDNLNPPAEIVNKANQLFDLKEIKDDTGVWMGNEDILISVEEKVTRIMIYDVSMNIKKFRRYITGEQR